MMISSILLLYLISLLHLLLLSSSPLFLLRLARGRAYLMHGFLPLSYIAPPPPRGVALSLFGLYLLPFLSHSHSLSPHPPLKRAKCFTSVNSRLRGAHYCGDEGEFGLAATFMGWRLLLRISERG